MNALPISCSALGLSASALLAMNLVGSMPDPSAVELLTKDADSSVASFTSSAEAGPAGGVDLLLAGEIPAEIFMPTGPAPETGAASIPNTAQPDGPQGLIAYPVAGGGLIREGSLSAHYVYYDQQTVGLPTPVNLKNRIAFVRGAGAYASIVKQAASFGPSAIFIITDTDIPTAPHVATGVPTYTIAAAMATRLGLTMSSAQHDVISTQPMRLTCGATLSESSATVAALN